MRPFGINSIAILYFICFTGAVCSSATRFIQEGGPYFNFGFLLLPLGMMLMKGSEMAVRISKVIFATAALASLCALAFYGNVIDESLYRSFGITGLDKRVVVYVGCGVLFTISAIALIFLYSKKVSDFASRETLKKSISD